MISAINTAISGLDAAGTRLAVNANNIANQNSTQADVGGHVLPQPYVAQQVDQVSLSNGGVQTRIQAANGQGTDAAQQEVGTNIAAYDFKANLKTIKVADDMEKSLLDIVG